MYEVRARHDFRKRYIDDFSEYLDTDNGVAAEDDPEWVVFLPVPRGEKGNFLLHALLVGHEIAHIQIAVEGLLDTVIEGAVSSADLDTIGLDRFSNVTDEDVRRARAFDWLAVVVRHWSEEFLADAMAVRLLGGAYALSALQFMLGHNGDPNFFSDGHPPWSLRFQLMKDLVVSMGDPGMDHGAYGRLLEELWDLANHVAPPSPSYEVASAWVMNLSSGISAAADVAAPISDDAGNSAAASGRVGRGVPA